MVTAAEWAPFFINLELRAAPALSFPSGLASPGQNWAAGDFSFGALDLSVLSLSSLPARPLLFPNTYSPSHIEVGRGEEVSKVH